APGESGGICCYMEFRHEFDVLMTEYRDENNLRDLQNNSRLYISADSDYAVYLNGRFIDCGQYDDFPSDKIYDILDLKYNIKNGRNTLCILVFYQGESSFQYKKGNPGLIYTLKINGKTAACSGSK